VEESQGRAWSQPLHVRPQNVRQRFAAPHGGFRAPLRRRPTISGQLEHQLFPPHHAAFLFSWLETFQKWQQILQGPALIHFQLLTLSLSPCMYVCVFHLNILTSSILVWLIVKV